MSSVPLTQAVTSGDASAVRAVLANGADANERTGGGQTPLILATIFGHTHLIPLLLEAGADPHLRDNLGLNAIDWAQRRGETEAIAILGAQKTPFSARTRIEVPIRQQPSASQGVEEAESERRVSEEERSQRWLAGLKQRIAEQAQRELQHGPNIFRRQPQPAPEPEQVEVAPAEPKPGPPIETVQPPIETVQPPIETIQPPVEAVQTPPPQPEAATPKTEDKVPRRSSSRKRCPKCNTIYNSDLLAYCAHHIVPLVDADESPIISEPPKQSPVLFWMIIVITLSGSIVLVSLITTFIYNPNNPAPQAAGTQPAANAVQKGVPIVGRELEGKVVSLPVAECPLNGQEPLPGTVVVRVTVDSKSGQVKSATASGGDWLLRGAASEAAMKSTFSPQKLRGRETEGTITYTFEP